jgi:malate synthase
VLLKNNGLHIEIVFDKTSQLGKVHHAGVSDIVFESALTAILDMEDSVAAVDAEDKAQCYRNMAGIMRGDLKWGKRELEKPKGPYTPLGGGKDFHLPGRVVALVRNVGLSMYSDMVTMDGEEVPEHFVDAMVTALTACHELKRPKGQRNSAAGSVYIVKPKMHGPDEVQMVMEMFTAVEDLIGIPKLTMKVGIMDEERRTTSNLQTCISRASERVVFINTGFLDRVGDEIHTSMELGPMYPKMQIRQQPFLAKYEAHNVHCGIKAKFSGRAQIGKGMWAQPDDMAGLYKQKVGHPQAGANTAWVPSPVGATVHVMHYHQVNVKDVQANIKRDTPREEFLSVILSPPVLPSDYKPSAVEIQHELDENCQSILGYVVRWVEQGIGCSKVPDLKDVQLMEDRATLRICSQLLANWIKHGLITQAQLDEALKKMSAIVDKQNSKDKSYQAMTGNWDKSLGFQAALALVAHGTSAKNGLTEPVLHSYRRKAKAASHPVAAKL